MWIIAGLALVHRLRRWTNVKPTLIPHLLGRFADTDWGMDFIWMSDISIAARVRIEYVTCAREIYHVRTSNTYVTFSGSRTHARKQWQGVCSFENKPADFVKNDNSGGSDSSWYHQIRSGHSDVVPTLYQCRASVSNAGPTLKQRWSSVGCLLNIHLVGQ